MWGAVIGDLAGSIFEYGQSKKVSSIEVKELITKDSFFTDDTILTCAIYDGIRYNNNYEVALRAYGKQYSNYKPNTTIEEIFPTTFGGRFAKWVNGEAKGDSIGNGAMMRISGIGKVFNTEEEVIRQAMRATKPSHNTIEAIDCSRTVALYIFYARQGLNKEKIQEKLGLENIQYRPFERFNKTCYETLSNCIYALNESNNFEEAIRKVISFGGDTDTNAAIVGGMAEALYGVPEYLVSQARKKIPRVFQSLLDEAYCRQMICRKVHTQR